jgi:hypothetical protein
MGAAERAAQYATNLWYAVFALLLLREARPTRAGSVSSQVTAGRDLTRLALLCGALSALVYAAMLIVVPMFWSNYSSATQTVSELSALAAPTRPLWVASGIVWMLLYAAFGWGVWKSAGWSRTLRNAGGIIFIAAVVGIFWPPMHLREVLAAGGGSLTDTLHIVWTAINGVLTLLAMGFAAAALGGRFRLYSIATMAIILAAGAVTSTDAAQLQANLPTPWMGVWERVNIGAWLLWVVVLSVTLSRRAAHVHLDARVALPASG